MYDANGDDYVSPYLLRPLRTVAEVLEARGFSGAVAAWKDTAIGNGDRSDPALRACRIASTEQAGSNARAAESKARSQPVLKPGLPHHQALGSTEE